LAAKEISGSWRLKELCKAVTVPETPRLAKSADPLVDDMAAQFDPDYVDKHAADPSRFSIGPVASIAH
jgi:hypothetical protein